VWKLTSLGEAKERHGRFLSPLCGFYQRPIFEMRHPLVQKAIFNLVLVLGFASRTRTRTKTKRCKRISALFVGRLIFSPDFTLFLPRAKFLNVGRR
jgi:hypothetical protein